MGPEDTVWGWTKKQYMVAWTYFKSYEVVYDKSLPDHEQDDSFMAALQDLQTIWLTKFQYDPCTGPMQVYDPEIPPEHRQVVEQIFNRLKRRFM